MDSVLVPVIEGQHEGGVGRAMTARNFRTVSISLRRLLGDLHPLHCCTAALLHFVRQAFVGLVGSNIDLNRHSLAAQIRKDAVRAF